MTQHRIAKYSPCGISSRTWLLVFFSLITATSAQATNDTVAQTPTGDLICRTSFSVDLYGLGVRMGYYFNWMSGWIANNYVPSEIASLQDTNSIFLLGLIASLLRGTYTRRLTRIDGLVLLELAIGTIWSVLSLWGYRTCVYKHEKVHGISNFGGFGTHFRLLLWTTVASYALWFFLVGVNPDSPHRLRLANNASCRHVLILGLGLSGGVRIAGIVFCILNLVYCGTMLASSSLAGITRSWKLIVLVKRGQYSASSRLRYISGLNHQQLMRVWQALRLVNFSWIVFVMTVIEVTLNQNHVQDALFETDDDFLTPSQLLPLLIGLMSFVRTIYCAYEHLRAGGDDIRPSLGVNLSASAANRLSRPSGCRRRILCWMKCCSHGFFESAPSATETNVTDDIERVFHQWTFCQKLMITLLPWLSVLSFWPWKNDPQAKRIEGFQDDSQSREPSSFQSKNLERITMDST